MPMTAAVSAPHWSGVACSAASAAAVGSTPVRSWLSDRSCAGRSGPASRQRISRGSRTFHSSRGRTVMPTRRRLVTTRMASSTRTTSRAALRETPYRASISSSRRSRVADSSPQRRSGPSRSSTSSCRPLARRDSSSTGSSSHSVTLSELKVIRIWPSGLHKSYISVTLAALKLDRSRRSAMNETDRPHRIVVMGVAGSGKTTVGSALAARLGLPFADADEFHPPANVAKMRAGRPLDDTDRRPWLQALGTWLADHPAGGVVSCSALRVGYRDLLRGHAPDLTFLHLAGDADVVTARVAARTDHFMPAS